MLTRKVWGGVALAALLAIAGANGSTGSGVTDDEGASVRGGQSGCVQYKSTIVFCGSRLCNGVTQSCGVGVKLESGTGTYAKNVQQVTNGYCITCGGYCLVNTFAYTNYLPCDTPTTDADELPPPGDPIAP